VPAVAIWTRSPLPAAEGAPRYAGACAGAGRVPAGVCASVIPSPDELTLSLYHSSLLRFCAWTLGGRERLLTCVSATPHCCCNFAQRGPGGLVTTGRRTRLSGGCCAVWRRWTDMDFSWRAADLLLVRAYAYLLHAELRHGGRGNARVKSLLWRSLLSATRHPRSCAAVAGRAGIALLYHRLYA